MRDQVQLEGDDQCISSCISVKTSASLLLPVLSIDCKPFPCLGRRVMSVMPSCCKSKDGKPGKSPWLSVAFLCLSSGVYFPPLGFGLFNLCD